jgi:hypothetical protein
VAASAWTLEAPSDRFGEKSFTTAICTIDDLTDDRFIRVLLKNLLGNLPVITLNGRVCPFTGAVAQLIGLWVFPTMSIIVAK